MLVDVTSRGAFKVEGGEIGESLEEAREESKC